MVNVTPMMESLFTHVDTTDMCCARVMSCLETEKILRHTFIFPLNVHLPRVQRRQLYLPLIFALLSDKQESTYTTLIKIIFDQC